jgi:hypothetical protein
MTAIPQVVSEHEHNVTARYHKTENQQHGQQPAGGRFVEYVKPDRNLTGVLSQQSQPPSRCSLTTASPNQRRMS